MSRYGGFHMNHEELRHKIEGWKPGASCKGIVDVPASAARPGWRITPRRMTVAKDARSPGVSFCSRDANIKKMKYPPATGQGASSPFPAKA